MLNLLGDKTKRATGFGPSPLKESEDSRSLDLIFHAIAFALDDHGLGVMEEAIQHGASQRRVVIEDLGPVLIRLVGREHDRTPLVALADDLEEQVGPNLVDGQITDLVDT